MAKNWLKTAVEAEQAFQTGQTNQAGQTQGREQKQPNLPSNTPPAVSPAPTQTPVQKAQAGKQQKSRMESVKNTILPDVAGQALPALNQSLYSLMHELMARGDLNLSETAARTLTIEIMSEWLAASRKGIVSDLASIVAQSPAISQLIGGA